MPSMLQVLAGKGSQVWSISPDATVFAGLTLMAEKNIGALLILENDRPVGIMSERDYARKIILDGRSSRETRIRSIMTTRLNLSAMRHGLLVVGGTSASLRSDLRAMAACGAAAVMRRWRGAAWQDDRPSA